VFFNFERDDNYRQQTSINIDLISRPFWPTAVKGQPRTWRTVSGIWTPVNLNI